MQPNQFGKLSTLIARLACAVAAALLPGCATPPSDRRPAIAIVGGNIIDPGTNGPPVPATVLLAGDRITKVASGLRPPRSARLIDAHGKFLLPGLWDMHSHLAALNEVGSKPENYVGHGVLAVRDMGGFMDQLQALKVEIGAGRVGPELVMAGPTLNGEAFADFQRVVATEEEGRNAVRELKAAGVNLIKVHRATSPEVFRAILEEARTVSLPVAGHVPLGLSWVDASNAGMHSIEHAQTLVENEISDRRDPAKEIPDAIRRLSGPKTDAIFGQLARNGTFFDPTLIYYENSIGNATPELAVRRREFYQWLKPIVGRANAAGVPMLAGTDMVENPGHWLLVELERLVEAGLTNRQALAAATSTAAAAAGRPDLAAIAPGSTASFLILDRDPLADVRNVRALSLVVLRGRIIDRAELQRMRGAQP